MPDNPAPERQSGQPPRRLARLTDRWLVIATIMTLVLSVLAGVQLAGLLGYPLRSTPSVPLSSEDVLPRLTVAVARTPGGPDEWDNWARVIKYVSDKTETHVEVRYLTKEDEAAQVILKDSVDLAFVCAHQYVDLAETGKYEGLCTPIINGSTTTNSMLIVRADDPATRIEDLRGSIVAASDKSSLGGYAYLALLMEEHGLDIQEYFGELRTGDTEEQDINDLADGEIRATVVNSAQVVARDMSAFKVIETSEPYGCPPVIVKVDLDPALRDLIESSLLEMNAREVTSQDSNIDGFRELKPSEYAFVYELRDACGHHLHD